MLPWRCRTMFVLSVIKTWHGAPLSRTLPSRFSSSLVRESNFDLWHIFSWSITLYVFHCEHDYDLWDYLCFITSISLHVIIIKSLNQALWHFPLTLCGTALPQGSISFSFSFLLFRKKNGIKRAETNEIILYFLSHLPFEFLSMIDLL